MKKRVISLILLCCGLLACTSIGLANDLNVVTAVIDGKTADRVHLREMPSTESKSLGLYFTGTEVMCQSNPNEEWAIVTVGSQSGWMKSEFLYRGSKPGSVLSKQPTAVVNNKKRSNWVNLRYEPSLDAAIAGKFYNGDVVTVLGETVTKWYYVQAGDLYGYMMSDYLRMGGFASSNASSSQGSSSTPRPNATTKPNTAASARRIDEFLQRTKEYILYGQDDKPSAGRLNWSEVFLDQVDLKTVYDQYLAHDGAPDSIASFAEFLTENAPINPNWQELTRADVRMQYGYTIVRFEQIQGVMYQAYVVVDGKEVPYVAVSARTGYYHG